MGSADLDGKIAIVTGGAQGIGKALVKGLVNQGTRVIIGDIDLQKALETASLFSDEEDRCSALSLDLGNIDSINNFVDLVIQRWGTVDILINNAGIATKEDFFSISPEKWDTVMNINLKGPFFLAQKVASVMVEKRSGKIVNTASTSSFVASSQCMIPYDVSKAGLKMLTSAMAVQLASSGINVNAVAPGSTNTKLLERLFNPDGLNMSIKNIPLQRLAIPEDIVGVVLFLCSNNASFITGHTLVVDGGYMLN